MKKAEMQNLKVGQVVMDKRTSGEWTITDITDKNVTLDFGIIVCHINHMIREEANSEEEFVKNFCKKITF